MLFFWEPGRTKMTEGVALVHQYSVGSRPFLALLFAYQSPWWFFTLLECWPNSGRAVTPQRLGSCILEDQISMMKLCTSSPGSWRHSRQGEFAPRWRRFHRGLWCIQAWGSWRCTSWIWEQWDAAIAYSAAFCTWKLFPASVGTASVLKTLEIREGKTFDHFIT